jgi:hypothetical protein
MEESVEALGVRTMMQGQSDDDLKSTKVFIKVSGNVLKGATVVLTVASVLPLVGDLCGCLQAVVDVCEARCERIKDMHEVANRVVDVGQFLVRLESVVEVFHQLPSSEGSKLLDDLSVLVEKLDRAIKKLLETVLVLKKSGFLKSMFMGNGLKALEILDDEISGLLEQMNEVYSLARDQSFANSLNVLLARTPDYKLGNQVGAIVHTIGSRVNMPGQTLRDDEIIREVLNDPEVVHLLEVEGGLSPDVVEEERGLLLQMDKKMDTVILLLHSMNVKLAASTSNVSAPLQPDLMSFVFDHSLNDCVPFFQVGGVVSLQMAEKLSVNDLIEMGFPHMRATLIAKAFNRDVTTKKVYIKIVFSFVFVLKKFYIIMSCSASVLICFFMLFIFHQNISLTFQYISIVDISRRTHKSEGAVLKMKMLD